MGLSTEMRNKIQQGIETEHFSNQYETILDKFEAKWDPERFNLLGYDYEDIPYVGSIAQNWAMGDDEVYNEFGQKDIEYSTRILGDTPKEMIEGVMDADEQLIDELNASAQNQGYELFMSFAMPDVASLSGIDTKFADVVKGIGGTGIFKKLATKLGMDPDSKAFSYLQKIFADRDLGMRGGAKMTFMQALIDNLSRLQGKDPGPDGLYGTDDDPKKKP